MGIVGDAQSSVPSVLAMLVALGKCEAVKLCFKMISLFGRLVNTYQDQF